MGSVFRQVDVAWHASRSEYEIESSLLLSLPRVY